MIPAKEFDGELWIKVSDHHQEIKRIVDSERETIYELVMFAPFKEDADLLMHEDEVEDNPFEDYFKSAEFRNSINNAIKATVFTICSAIRARGKS